MKKTTILLIMMAISLFAQAQTARMVDPSEIPASSQNYVNNRAPLPANPFIKLPVTSVTPRGWIGEMIRRQSEGLAGKLGEISVWLDKKDNAWLSEGGSHGWEEVPYWLRGYSNMAYMLGDKDMLAETKLWVEAILRSSKDDGFLGPINDREGRREVWANMLALQILQDYYDYSGDTRVIDALTAYYRWELSYPEEKFLRHYWENSRGGDNLLSVIWLYNRTGEPFLLELAEKIHRCTANWMQESTLPNWHNVNVAECFREPAEYYLVSRNPAALRATYDDFHLIRRIYGQVPGGMFGSDENCRHGYIDPRQGTETCGFVEQMLSDEILMAQTGDLLWMENLEDVAFNSLPAAFMPDQRSLRYITSPNMVQADSRNHHPGIDNPGPYLMMNPFSSRCCQHNHTMAWPYYAQNLVLASADGGAALLIYGDCSATLRVADGQLVTIDEQTHYPFEEDVTLTMSIGKDKKKGKKRAENAVAFPLYLRIPTWTPAAHVSVNGTSVPCQVTRGGLLCIQREWHAGDEVKLHFPMNLTLRRWALNKNSVSVDYGPLTLSLLIGERYEAKNSRQTAQHDSGWQEGVDDSQWPSYEIYPETPWNYGIVPCVADMTVERLPWPADNYPFTLTSVPLRVTAHGARIPSWGQDETGLCQILPDADAPRGSLEDITLVPMGAARLRISAFPPVELY
jgi:hypothetical protein